jgi:hypothetical protein
VLANLRCFADPDSMTDSPLIVKDYFQRREFCYTMADDVFIRYQCFRDAADFAKSVQARQPYKIDIGPLMSVKVCATQSFSDVGIGVLTSILLALCSLPCMQR